MKYADDKVKLKLFQKSRGCNSKTNNSIWPVFELFWDVIHVHLICTFQEDRIKTKQVTLMTKSQRGFFSNQGDITLRVMIWPDQIFNSFEILSKSTLSTSFRNIQSKLKMLRWWQAFFHCKSMGPCCCHNNQNFHWISMKSLCLRCPTIGMP